MLKKEQHVERVSYVFQSWERRSHVLHQFLVDITSLWSLCSYHICKCSKSHRGQLRLTGCSRHHSTLHGGPWFYAGCSAGFFMKCPSLPFKKKTWRARNVVQICQKWFLMVSDAGVVHIISYYWGRGRGMLDGWDESIWIPSSRPSSEHVLTHRLSVGFDGFWMVFGSFLYHRIGWGKVFKGPSKKKVDGQRKPGFL